MGLRTNERLDDLCTTGSLLWEHVKDPREPGRDGLLKRAFRVAEYRNVVIELPAGAVVELVDTEFEGAGTYFHTEVFGVNLHFRDGLKPTAGEVVICDVQIYLETWEPDWSELSEAERRRRRGYRNYKFKLNATPCAKSDAQARMRLHIRDVNADGYTRMHKDITGDGERFAHMSPDWKPDGSKPWARNQDLQLLQIRTKAGKGGGSGKADKPETKAGKGKGNGKDKPPQRTEAQVVREVDGEARTSMRDLLRNVVLPTTTTPSGS